MAVSDFIFMISTPIDILVYREVARGYADYTLLPGSIVSGDRHTFLNYGSRALVIYADLVRYRIAPTGHLICNTTCYHVGHLVDPLNVTPQQIEAIFMLYPQLDTPSIRKMYNL